MKIEDVNIALYADGMSFLYRSGAVQWLKEHGELRVVGPGPDYAERHIAEANMAIGYAKALNDLLYFQERFMMEKVVTGPAMDFGAAASLLEKKIITQEEANDITKQFRPTPRS